MVITNIEQYKSRFKIYLDGNFAFLLYKGDLKRYNLQEGSTISDEIYSDLLKVLYNRGRERALYMLDRSYKTEKYIYDKLKAGYYPEDIIEMIIDNLTEIDLINDARYAALYIEYKAQVKSKRQIQYDLLNKGINRDIIQQAFEEMNFSDIESLDKLIIKRKDKYDMSDIGQKSKFIAYLASKGYSYDDIRTRLDYLT